MNLRNTRRAILSLVLVSILVGLTGCKKKPIPGPDYSRQLPPGQSALRQVPMPDLTGAFLSRDEALAQAIDRSVGWYNKKSSTTFFPFESFSHEQALASAIAMRHLIHQAHTPEEFQKLVDQDFNAFISVGWNNEGTVLFTGYYTPIFNASATRTAQYAYPLYKRPADLQADPVSGQTLGRRMPDGSVQTYPTRREIESSNMFAGQELVWLPSRLDAYIIQVNGSAKLTMTDGSTRYIGYAGNNGHEYTSIGKALVEEGKIEKNRLSLPTLRAYFEQHPEELDGYIQKNDRFVFFQDYNSQNWPAGSLGVKVTSFRSLATDKALFPRGAVVFTTTQIPTAAGDARPFDQLMLDQDTGGAIRAAGRADIYMGIGSDAEQLAGRQFAEGKMYYLLLKPERVQDWLQKNYKMK